jgi:hypothetical protein
MVVVADVGFWEGIARDLSGKGQFRLLLQPAMAVFLGVRLGIADAKDGKAPFLFRLFSEPGRWTLLKNSLRDVALPLSVALVTDGILQYLTLGRVRLLAAMIVGALLVWFPFAVTRGFSNRIWKRVRPTEPLARAK